MCGAELKDAIRREGELILFETRDKTNNAVDGCAISWPGMRSSLSVLFAFAYVVDRPAQGPSREDRVADVVHLRLDLVAEGLEDLWRAQNLFVPKLHEVGVEPVRCTPFDANRDVVPEVLGNFSCFGGVFRLSTKSIPDAYARKPVLSPQTTIFRCIAPRVCPKVFSTTR